MIVQRLAIDRLDIGIIYIVRKLRRRLHILLVFVRTQTNIPLVSIATAKLIRIIINFAHQVAYSRIHISHSASPRSEEHTSELQSLMRISYAVFCLKKKSHTKRTEARSHHTPIIES